eukprot:gnl/Dysnectes_brevis/1136_a1268_2384.p1 GENE.gnl/Dysnectes_brevis/1136_a1268_2384~~gnl/Dysnectes_brevis/1136_a1268_2384.p1  ORF type:complete len:479 (+),score=188.46 gnl/Dysnectes_brevis/1136_a1268_2384:30-1439(+)
MSEPSFINPPPTTIPYPATLPKVARKNPAYWAKLTSPMPQITEAEHQKVVEFKAHMEEHPIQPGAMERFSDFLLAQFMRVSKGDFKTCRNLLIQSHNFRASFDTDHLSIYDVEEDFGCGFKLAMSNVATQAGRPIFYFDYHFPNGITPQNLLSTLKIFIYFCKVAEDIMEQCGQAPIFLADMNNLTRKDFDPRLEKSLVRLYTEIYPGILGPMLGPNSPWWVRFAMKMLGPWLPKDMVMICEKRQAVTDAIIPPAIAPAPFGQGPGIAEFVAWRKEVEGPRPERRHQLSDAVLRSWNITISLPAREQPALCKGWGFKRTKAGRKWAKYFFLLDDGILFYYKKDKSNIANNGILLEEAVTRTLEEEHAAMERARVTKKSRDCCVVLETLEREYFFSFPSPEIMEQWRTALQSEITRRQEETGVHFGEGRVVMVEDMGLDGAEEEELDAFEEAEAAEVEALEAEIAAAEAE